MEIVSIILRRVGSSSINRPTAENQEPTFCNYDRIVRPIGFRSRPSHLLLLFLVKYTHSLTNEISDELLKQIIGHHCALFSLISALQLCVTPFQKISYLPGPTNQ